MPLMRRVECEIPMVHISTRICKTWVLLPNKIEQANCSHGHKHSVVFLSDEPGCRADELKGRIAKERTACLKLKNPARLRLVIVACLIMGMLMRLPGCLLALRSDTTAWKRSSSEWLANQIVACIQPPFSGSRFISCTMSLRAQITF
jgi:hypothetical protein